ncbi:hypothetical protein Bca4012_020899 [Brassica carinata]
MDFSPYPGSTPDPPDEIDPFHQDQAAVQIDSSPSSKIIPSSAPVPIPLICAPSYAQRFKDSLRNLEKICSPIAQSEGFRVVEAPDSIILKASEEWKDHILAKFHGRIPHQNKIFSDLNPGMDSAGGLLASFQRALTAYPWTPDCSLEE